MMSVLVRASNWIRPRCDSMVCVSNCRKSSALGVTERTRQHTQFAGERLLVRQLRRCASSSARTVSGAMRTIVPSMTYPPCWRAG